MRGGRLLIARLREHYPHDSDVLAAAKQIEKVMDASLKSQTGRRQQRYEAGLTAAGAIPKLSKRCGRPSEAEKLAGLR